MTQAEICKKYYLSHYDNGVYNLEQIYQNRKRKEKINISFLMTQDCNAQCPYCYQHGSFRAEKGMMTKQIVDDSMDFILSLFQETDFVLTLFGGEPLLNFEVVKYILKTYPMFRYTVVTNGKLLNENSEMVKWLVNNRGNFRLSVSVSALKYLYPDRSFQASSSKVLDILNQIGGDAHYVIADPRLPEVFDDIKFLFEKNVQFVRISTARQWNLLQDTVVEMTELYKRLIDYIYFREKPLLGRVIWDRAFRSNQYARRIGRTLKPSPPTHCGCGYMYLAINPKGELYPCDNFAFMPEFKIGDIYNGFDKDSIFFTKMREWFEGLFEKCDNCGNCVEGNLLYCPRALCLAENYAVNHHPFAPTINHCLGSKVEHDAYEYLITKAMEAGIDKLIERSIVV